MANVTVNAKLSIYGCPACKALGSFNQAPNKDMIHCLDCDTWFSMKWLMAWDGTFSPEMQGTHGPDPFESGPSSWEPYPVPANGDSLYMGLLLLQEKVVRFREAVLNPDRVTTDEQIEGLLREMFDVSYTLPLSNDLDDEITPLDDVDPLPPMQGEPDA